MGGLMAICKDSHNKFNKFVKLNKLKVKDRDDHGRTKWG